MLRAYGARDGNEAQKHTGAGGARAAGGGGWAWLAVPALFFPGLALCAYAQITDADGLSLPGFALIAASMALLAAEWLRHERRARQRDTLIGRLEQAVAANTGRIGSVTEGISLMSAYAMRPGDGAAACPRGGGDDCPQVIHAAGREWVTGTGPTTGEIARFLDAQEGGGHASSPGNPGGWPA